MCFFTLIANTFCSLNLKMAHKRPCFCCSKAIIDEVNGLWIEVLECSTIQKICLQSTSSFGWGKRIFWKQRLTNIYAAKKIKLIDT
jgi:hypothetical protein